MPLLLSYWISFSSRESCFSYFRGIYPCCSPFLEGSLLTTSLFTWPTPTHPSVPQTWVSQKILPPPLTTCIESGLCWNFLWILEFLLCSSNYSSNNGLLVSVLPQLILTFMGIVTMSILYTAQFSGPSQVCKWYSTNVCWINENISRYRKLGILGTKLTI